MAILKRILKLTHQEAVIKVINEDASPAAVTISLAKDLFRFDETMNGYVTGTPPTSNTAGIAPPSLAAIMSTPGGGLIPAGTYYYSITGINALGETLRSNGSPVVATGPNSTVKIGFNPTVGATSYRVYRGTAAGNESLYKTVLPQFDSAGLQLAINIFIDTGIFSSVPLSEVSFSLFANGATIVRNSETIMILHENDSNNFEMSRAKDSNQASSDLVVTMGKGSVYIRVLKEQGYLANFRPEQNGGL